MKILLIEDNTAVQEYVKDLVARFSGVSYDLVVTGMMGKALPYFNDDDIGVIILDLNLPDSQGLETFRTVYRHAGHIPIIILTGTDDNGLALEAVEGGAQDYLLKGEISVQVLQKAVQYAIERHRTLRELEMANSWLRTEEEALEDRQRQLRISESLYRTLFLTVGAPTAILDEEGKVILANADVESLFGFPPGEVEGKVHWSQFVPPDELPRLTELWRLLHEDPAQASQRYESRLVDRWGRIKYGIVSMKLIPHTKNCVISITDITGRKHMEEALRESEVRFRELYDRMSNGVAVYQAVEGGEDFIIQDINRAAEKIEGVARKEVFGKRVTDVFPGVRDLGLLGVFRRVWETGKPEYLPSAVYRNDRSTGNWRENWVYRLPSGEIVAVYNDITERVRADTALRESEERQRLLLEYSGLGIAYWDYDGALLFLNRKAAENMGGEAADFTGKRMADLFPPDLARVYLGRIDSMRGEGGSREYEDLVPLPGGDRWFLSTFTSVKNAHGEPLGVQIISQEITDRKRMEEALHQRENTLETLLNAPMDLMGLLDTTGTIIAMNESGARMMKRDAGGLVGRNTRDLFPPDINERRMAHLGQVVETGIPVEFEDVREGRSFLNRMFPVFNPRHSRVEQVAVIASDITERRRAEEALRESEEKFRTVVEHVPDLILVHSDGIIRYINPGTVVSRVTGYTPEEMIGKPILDYVVPEYHAQVIDATVRRMKEDPVEPYEIVILSRYGRRTFMVSGSRIEFEGKPSILNVLTDIEDLKQAELALREGEERYRAVIESQTEFITRFTPGFVVTFVNDAYCTYFGIRRDEVVGKRFKPLIPEEDREAVQRHFASLSREKPVATIEHRTIAPDGKVKWQKWVDRAIYDGKGALVEYQSVGRDTTDRRQAEEALRESEEKYRSLVERANDGIAILQEGRVCFVNQNQARLWGGRPEDIVGRPFTDFVHPGERVKLLERYQKRLTGEKIISVYETVLRRRDGTDFPGEISAGVISYEGRPADLVIIRDITERKMAGEALRESEARLNAVVDGSPIPQFVIGKDHRILYWNRALEEMSGIRATDIVGTSRQWKAFYPEERPVLADLVVDEDIPQIHALYASKFRPSKFIEGAYEAVDFFPNLREGGGWLYFTAAPVRDMGGSIIGAVETLEDITDRKRAEAALRQSEEKYRDLAEASRDLIYIIDERDTIVYVNSRALEFLGKGMDEVVGKPRSLFFPQEANEAMKRSLGKVFSTGETVRIENPIPSPLGLSWQDTTLTPLRNPDGTVTRVMGISRDITGRKRMEEALKESEEKYRNLVERANDGIVLIQDGIIAFCNRRIGDFWGGDVTEITGKPMAEFVAPAEREKTGGFYIRAMSGESLPDRFETTLLRRDGSMYPAELTPGIITYRGKPAALVVIRDITERKKAEEALRESEERYRTVIETANEAIVVAQDGILKFVNPKAVEMLESTPEYIGSVPFAEFIHPDDRDMVVERYMRRIGGEDIPSNYDFRFIGKQGRVTWVHISAARITWNGRPATLNFLMDVTERRKMEQALKDSEEMFRNPVEQSPVGVYLFQDGAIRYTNPRLSEIFGYTHEEASSLPFEQVIHPDDLQKVREEIGRWMLGDEGPKTITFRGLKKDGTPVDLEIYSSNMLYQGRPATYGTVIDITGRKRLENQIRDSLMEKEVLLKEIHHRVKNNMQVISSLLSVQSQNITDETVRGLFKESQNRIRSIALVHELLYRSEKLDRIEYGAYLKKMFVPLFESYCVDQRKVAMEIEARDTMITIEKAVPCSLIVNELISNSLKHAFPGGRKGEIRIGFGFDAESGMYVLDYQDSGVGLPEGLDVTACPTLGLRLVHGLTKQLQGTIEVGNRGGAHFHITFPAESGHWESP
jgi:PAS domain S-box-containing protein